MIGTCMFVRMTMGVGAYGESKSRPEEPMSAEPDHASVPPAPTAAAQLLSQLRLSARAATWVPAFEQD